MEFHTERVLYHEAGHAVIAFNEGISIKSITVEPTDEALGMVTRYPAAKWFVPGAEWSPRIMDRIDSYVRISLAGMRAETKWAATQEVLPRNWKHHVRDGGRSDMDNARGLSRHRTSREAEAAYFKWLEAEVDFAFSYTYGWMQVETLVSELRAKPRLTGTEVKCILRSL